jgi:hypothetical protein
MGNAALPSDVPSDQIIPNCAKAVGVRGQEAVPDRHVVHPRN